MFIFVRIYLRWDGLPRREAEESPDRTGRPAAESAGGGNLTEAVTENNRPKGQG